MTNDTILKTDAAELAHAYAIYREALVASDDAGIQIYGDWLISMQTRMGLELIDSDSVRASIRRSLDA